jgi:hypothetical protein
MRFNPEKQLFIRVCRFSNPKLKLRCGLQIFFPSGILAA